MTHEVARHPVFRLWLRAFAGIVAVVFLPVPVFAAASEGEISATNIHARAAFAAKENGRTPAGVFLMESGVYELDTSAKAVRVWQRSDDGLEFFRPKDETEAVPMESLAAKQAGAVRFSGKDAAGNGTAFKQPVGMDREPGGARFAVVNAGEWIERANNRFCPSVQVYSLEEKTGDDGSLSSVSITFEDEWREAFYTTTSGAQRVISGIEVRAWAETNVVDTLFSTNWVHVISENPYRAITNDNATGGTILISTNTVEDISFHEQIVTNYVWQYTITTNANYLSTATDVAFLGDRGLVVSMTADERRTVPSGLVVFDLSDSSAKGAIWSVSDLPGVIRRIAVDPVSGEIYAAVPDAGAVYRFKAPGTGPGSWVDAIDRSVDIGVYVQGPAELDEDFVAGVPGDPGASFGKLSSPGGMSVWRSASLDEPVLLVADTANNRVAAFDYAGTPLFTFGTAGGIASDSLNNPKDVWGEEGADVIAVADGSGRRVRLFGPDLSGVDADAILSLSMVWPSTAVDLLVEDGLAFRDVFHTNTVDSVSILAVESDEGTNILRFVVPPSREDRTYTFSVAGADGIVDPVSATATVPAGETEGSFVFYAKDGVVNEDGSIPAYRATVTSPSGETAEAWVAVLNANPTITEAGMAGFEIMDLFGGSIFVTTGFSITATDVEADSALSYYWYATTNVNWALNNLDWAVTNHDWAAGSDWTPLEGAELVVTNWVSYETDLWDDYDGSKHYFTVETRTASLFAEQESTPEGTVLNPIHLHVASGREVDFPAVFGGMAVGEDVAAVAGQIIVLAVVDKDGGYTIVHFGKDGAADGSPWVPASGTVDPDEGADYKAEFTAITPSNVVFVVTVKSGTPAASDTVTLKSATSLDQDSAGWKTVKTFRVGPEFKAGASSVEETQAIQMTQPVLFYHVVQP